MQVHANEEARCEHDPETLLSSPSQSSVHTVVWTDKFECVLGKKKKSLGLKKRERERERVRERENI